MFSVLKSVALAAVACASRAYDKVKEGATALAVAVVVGASSLVAQPASAQSLPDASAQLTAISTSITNYATVMFGIAIVAVGILVGVKWIKRGKGAA